MPAVFAAALAAGALAPPAHADELPVTAISPANEAIVSPGEISFQMQSPIVFNAGETCSTQPFLAVSTQDVLNQVADNGTLASDYVVKERVMTASQATPGLIYTTTPAALSLGTYFWQVTATCIDWAVNPSTITSYASPVFSFVVEYPPAAPPSAQAPSPGSEPPLTIASAVTELKSLIRSHSRHNAYHFKSSCNLTGTQTATCTATWSTTKHVLGATTVYAGTFKINASYKPPAVSFTGMRALSRCMLAHRHQPSRCQTHVAWR